MTCVTAPLAVGPICKVALAVPYLGQVGTVAIYQREFSCRMRKPLTKGPIGVESVREGDPSRRHEERGLT